MPLPVAVLREVERRCILEEYLNDAGEKRVRSKTGLSVKPGGWELHLSDLDVVTWSLGLGERPYPKMQETNSWRYWASLQHRPVDKLKAVWLGPLGAFSAGEGRILSEIKVPLQTSLLRTYSLDCHTQHHVSQDGMQAIISVGIEKAEFVCVSLEELLRNLPKIQNISLEAVRALRLRRETGGSPHRALTNKASSTDRHSSAKASPKGRPAASSTAQPSPKEASASAKTSPNNDQAARLAAQTALKAKGTFLTEKLNAALGKDKPGDGRLKHSLPLKLKGISRRDLENRLPSRQRGKKSGRGGGPGGGVGAARGSVAGGVGGEGGRPLASKGSALAALLHGDSEMERTEKSGPELGRVSTGLELHAPIPFGHSEKAGTERGRVATGLELHAPFQPALGEAGTGGKASGPVQFFQPALGEAGTGGGWDSVMKIWDNIFPTNQAAKTLLGSLESGLRGKPPGPRNWDEYKGEKASRASKSSEKPKPLGGPAKTLHECREDFAQRCKDMAVCSELLTSMVNSVAVTEEMMEF